MNCFTRYTVVIATVIASLFSGIASAEQKAVLGDWDVHYIVFNTRFLTADVAKQYGVVRSRYNALINISVLDSDSQQAQNVSLSGTATNLLGTAKALRFKKVAEGDAIYYLASLKYDNLETYRFDIQVQSGSDTQKLKFTQKLYTE